MAHKCGREHENPFSQVKPLPRSLPHSRPKHIISRNFVRCQFSFKREPGFLTNYGKSSRKTPVKVLHMCWATLSVTPELTILSFYLPSRPPTQQNASVDRQLAMKFTESEKLGL